MSRDKGEQNVRALAQFIFERDQNNDWGDYAHANGNSLSRTAIAEACSFNRSVIKQNAMVRKLFLETEERLKRAGIIGCIPLPTWSDDCTYLAADIELALVNLRDKITEVTKKQAAFNSQIEKIHSVLFPDS